MTSHRLALIGAGAIARDHVDAISRIPSLTLHMAIDRHADRARRLAAVADAPRWSTSLDDALNDPAIDAVIICTSPESHLDVAVACAQAGKGILLEKPIALSLTDADAILDAVRAAKVPFLLGQSTRFQPVNLAVAEGIRAGEIGKPRAIHISYYAGHLWPGGWRAWQLLDERSGGHVVHNGTHPVDLAIALMGSQPTRVFARSMTSFWPDFPTPDSYHLTLRFENGSIALIEWCYALQQRGDFLRRIAVFGTEGTLFHSTEGEEFVHSNAVRPVPIATLGTFDKELAHFADILSGTAAAITTPGEIRTAIATVLAAQRSLETQQPEAIILKGASHETS